MHLPQTSDYTAPTMRVTDVIPVPLCSPTPADAVSLLREHGVNWWRDWQPELIASACEGVPVGALSQWPEVAFWRAMASLMQERADALECLEQAHAAHVATGNAFLAAVVANAALVLCLLDTGAMDKVSDWQVRVAGSERFDPPDGLLGLWLRLGWLARKALGESDLAAAGLAAAWLHAQLRPLRETLSPNERLIAAQVLVEYHFAEQHYEQFDFLATLVESPGQFEAASPLMRARWFYAIGYAHYQVGETTRAQQAWQEALEVAQASDLGSLRLLASLALVRLLIDRGGIDEADRVLESVRPLWGAGRTAQLIELKQMRARVQLLRGQPVQALVTLNEALKLADAAGLSASEQASCRTDLAQVLIAVDRADEAVELLTRLAAEHSGRDAQVYGCLQSLLQAWRSRDDKLPDSRAALSAGLVAAQGARYMMFFRLLPDLAARLCMLALRWNIESPFVLEVIRSRTLQAPDDADASWPWAVWIRLLGGFEMWMNGAVPSRSGKTPQKPLELLRLLACERNLSMSMQDAMQSLWPDADNAARKNLEMTIQRLRRLMGDDTLVQVSDGRVGLDVARVSSDVQQRRRLVDRIEALAMRPVRDPSNDASQHECVDLFERVMAFTAGDLLPGAPAAAWLDVQRQRVRQDTVRAALAAAAAMERGQASLAETELLETALRIEPMAESLVRRLMLAYDRAGQRADALRVFESFRCRLMSLGMAPSALTDSQWREVLAARH